MKEWTISDADAGARLDAWLARQSDVGSRGRASEWIARGKVYHNGAATEASSAGLRLRAGDRVGLWVDRPGSSRTVDRAVHDARSLLEVVHEDAALIVVNKPPGLIVEPLPGRRDDEVTLVHLLEDHLRHAPRARPHVVHRIDRDTSGLVLFARTPAARDDLKSQFEARTPTRLYHTVVRGHLWPRSGIWRDLLAWDRDDLIQRRAHSREAGAKEAMARFKVLEEFADASLLEVSLVTGKRNQIRVQAGLRGHPLIGERQYRFGAPPDPPGEPTLDRQALHAMTLGFTHPTSGTPVTFFAPLPDDLRRLVAALRSSAGRLR
jgi:23S rRNA pseudouridine1911/1915/1917 synthase